MAESTLMPALPYHEPSTQDILVISSFILLLNSLSYIVDRLLYCGMIGQILLGMAYGAPSLHPPLSLEFQRIAVQLGYLGLLLLIYEGGLSTDFRALKTNLLFSSAVALTGIAIPIGLSFALMGFADASPLQAFAAGAALCSTSLGTTFAVMGTTGLLNTRMGVVLTSAAMLDDVVGLVMVQVISNLGGPGGSFDPVTIIRPVLVSVAFAITVPLVAKLMIQPITLFVSRKRMDPSSPTFDLIFTHSLTNFIIHFLILVGLVVGSSYAGTSNLFAAYLAGASISWWDSDVPHQVHPNVIGASNSSIDRTNTNIKKGFSGVETFEKYFTPALTSILKPFFFASIGFSIPISRMFSGTIVWRGLIYTALMAFAKLVCGMWLIRLPSVDTIFGGTVTAQTPVVGKFSLFITKSRLSFWRVIDLWCPAGTRAVIQSAQQPDGPPPSTSRSSDKITEVVSCHNDANQSSADQPSQQPAGSEPPRDLAEKGPRTSSKTPVDSSKSEQQKNVRQGSEPVNETTNTDFRQQETQRSSVSASQSQKRPLSLYPAAIVGCAMVSRGEIGFLISSLADAGGIFTGSDASDELFLVANWAILLCTIVGPLAVGTLVRRVRQLECERFSAESTRQDHVLGIWGVN